VAISSITRGRASKATRRPAAAYMPPTKAADAAGSGHGDRPFGNHPALPLTRFALEEAQSLR